MGTASSIRAYTGPVFFERGFRPFFFAAGAFGAAALPLWLYLFASGADLPAYVSGREWHIHEMLYGYLAAAMTGFVLTAVPNWTGRMPVTGGRLAALFVLWLAGRAAFFFSAAAPALMAAVDAAYLVALAALVWREVIAGGNRRNIPVCVLVSLLALANVLFHVTRLTETVIIDGLFDERLGLAAAATLLLLIGGRVTPSFTRNWLMRQGIMDEAKMPAPMGPLDKSAALVALVALGLWLFLPDWKLTAFAFAVAAVRHFMRVARWKGLSTFAEPLVTILHIGYFWLPVWFLLMAVSIAWPEFLGYSTAVHALTAGAITTMTLAIMTRASLGHSGRKLTADRITTAIYVLAVIGAVVRICAPFLPMGYMGSIHLAGSLTAVAFLLFAWHYAPIFFRPRPKQPA